MPSLTPESPAADILNAAADHIDTHGLNSGHYWPTANWRTYERGDACCTVGAIAVALGIKTAISVELELIPSAVQPDFDEPPHPAVAALMDHLGVDLPGLFRWSDGSTAPHVAATLRDCAAALRGAEVAA